MRITDSGAKQDKSWAKFLVWKVAFKELRRGFKGFWIFFGCLFFGVFAVAAVGSFSQAAKRGLSDDARLILGGDVGIRLNHRQLTQEQAAWIGERAAVSETVQFRAMAARPNQSKNQTENAAGRLERLLVEVKAVDDAYPLYENLVISPDMPLSEALGKRNGRFGAVVEVSLLRRMGLEIGDSILLGEGEYEITAAIEKELDRTVRAFNLGPRFLAASRSLPATGLIAPGSLLSYVYSLKLKKQGSEKAFVEELNNRFPDAGWRVRTYENASPRLNFFLKRTTVNLTLAGLCSLLVGGLGISGAVRGYLGARAQNIATMKCLGAERKFVMRSYLLQLMLLAGIAIASGAVLGGVVPLAVINALGDKFPLPYSLGFPFLPILNASAFGFLATLMFSLRPLDVACQVSPAILFRTNVDEITDGNMDLRPGKAILFLAFLVMILLILTAVFTSDDRTVVLWFFASLAGAYGLFKLLAKAMIRLAGLVSTRVRGALRYGVLNVRRSPASTEHALLSIGFGLASLVAVTVVQLNLSGLVNETISGDTPSFFFIGIQPGQVAEFDSLAASLPGVRKVERQPTLQGRITAIAGVPVDKAEIDPDVAWAVRGDRYLTYSAKQPENGKISAGKWWPENYSGPPLISLTSDLSEGFGVTVGDTLTLNVLGKDITAEIYSLRDVNWSTLQMNFAIVFSPGVIEKAPQNHIAAIYASVESEADVMNAISGKFPNISVIGVREVLENAAKTLARVGMVFKAAAALVLCTGLLVLAGTLAAEQRRRLRDSVILKVGYSILPDKRIFCSWTFSGLHKRCRWNNSRLCRGEQAYGDSLFQQAVCRRRRNFAWAGFDRCLGNGVNGKRPGAEAV